MCAMHCTLQATQKEARWRLLVDEARQLATAQAALQRQRFDVAMQGKNEQLAGFRSELDAILGAAHALQLRRTPQQ